MKQWPAILEIIKAFRYKLIATYALYALEMLGVLSRPLLISIAINDLIKQSYRGLIWLVAVHAIWLLIGMIRHRFDTRTYTSIYNDLIKKLLHKSYVTNDVSKLSARSGLAKDVVDFFEYDIYFIIEAGYNIFGSIVLLAYYQSSIVWLCLSILIPVAITSIWYSHKITALQKNKNDELETQVDVIQSGDFKKIHSHYNNLRSWQIKISDSESFNFGMMELMVIIVITGALLMSFRAGTLMPLTGDFVGIYYYILKFVGGLDTVPYALQRWSVLGDLIKRLNNVEPTTFPMTPIESVEPLTQKAA